MTTSCLIHLFISIHQRISVPRVSNDAGGAAFLRDTFVSIASIYVRDQEMVRSFVGIAARMRIAQLDITLPSSTELLQDQLFAAVRCRDIHVTIVRRLKTTTDFQHRSVLGLVASEGSSIACSLPFWFL